MFIKGLIYGILVIALNALLLYLTIRHFLRSLKKFTALAFFLFYLLRYAVLGLLVYLFLVNRWGSPLGLLVGITVGLIAFVALRRRY
ncbi:MAG: ATP synthase subunit I [bacterium]